MQYLPILILILLVGCQKITNQAVIDAIALCSKNDGVDYIIVGRVTADIHCNNAAVFNISSTRELNND